MRATTATGSVALVMAPKNRAVFQSHPKGNTYLEKHAIKIVATITPGPASISTCAAEKKGGEGGGGPWRAFARINRLSNSRYIILLIQ